MINSSLVGQYGSEPVQADLGDSLRKFMVAEHTAHIQIFHTDCVVVLQ